MDVGVGRAGEDLRQQLKKFPPALAHCRERKPPTALTTFAPSPAWAGQE